MTEDQRLDRLEDTVVGLIALQGANPPSVKSYADEKCIPRLGEIAEAIVADRTAPRRGLRRGMVRRPWAVLPHMADGGWPLTPASSAPPPDGG
jgi:hypothetical protein